MLREEEFASQLILLNYANLAWVLARNNVKSLFLLFCTQGNLCLDFAELKQTWLVFTRQQFIRQPNGYSFGTKSIRKVKCELNPKLVRFKEIRTAICVCRIMSILVIYIYMLVII